MRRIFTLLLIVVTLFLACEPNDWVGYIPPENGDNTEQPTPTPEPEPEPEPVNRLTEGWLELPADDMLQLYPDGEVLKLSVGGERNYTALYDKFTYASMWVAYPLEAKHMGSYDRPDDWSYNPLISVSYQVNLCKRSYTDTNIYSRGHLIPNASRNGIYDMQLQTFYVTNSVPQVQNKFNNGIWSSLEGALQTIANSEKLYIVTGVAFAKVGESKSVGYTTAKDEPSKQVPIPNYFYKVVLKVSTDSGGVVTSASTIGFWFENKAYSDNSYTNYAVSVDQVEQWTGFDFFVNLPDPVESSAESNTDWNTFQKF